MAFKRCPVPFFGASLYVPLLVGLGYVLGLGIGGYVARLRRVVGAIERLILAVAVLALMGWRALRAARTRGEP